MASWPGRWGEAEPRLAREEGRLGASGHQRGVAALAGTQERHATAGRDPSGSVGVRQVGAPTLPPPEPQTLVLGPNGERESRMQEGNSLVPLFPQRP